MTRTSSFASFLYLHGSILLSPSSPAPLLARLTGPTFRFCGLESPLTCRATPPCCALRVTECNLRQACSPLRVMVTTSPCQDDPSQARAPISAPAALASQRKTPILSALPVWETSMLVRQSTTQSLVCTAAHCLRLTREGDKKIILLRVPPTPIHVCTTPG